MFVDLCYPSGDESRFLDIAKRLGTKKLCFIYPSAKLAKNKPCAIEVQKKQVNCQPGTILLTGNTSRAKLNDKHILIYYGFESNSKKDKTHYRNSGLDQVSLALMKSKYYAFSPNRILNSADPAILFGRISQNARLMKKYKTNLLLASLAETPEELRPLDELRAMARVLGFSEMQVQEAGENLDIILKKFGLSNI